MEETTRNRPIRTRKTTQEQAILEHGKIPPQAVDMEEAVLGAMMLEQNALTNVIDLLKPEFFYKDAHQRIFRAIHLLFSSSEPVDILTVTQQLKKLGELDIVGGAYYVTQLTNRVASAANVEFHARVISEKYIQRELIRISSDVIRESFDESCDVLDLLDRSEKELLTVGEKNFHTDYTDMHSLIREAIHEIESAKNQESGVSGVPSGFTALDRVTSGWQKSNLLILAARPAMGKTAFALTMARNIAVEFKKPVAFFSLEMSAVELVTRLISSETMLEAEKLKKGTLKDFEWEQLHAKIKPLIEASLFIDDTPSLSVFELRAKCRRLKQKHDIQMVFIDYLQLMHGSSDNKGGNREQEISHISRSLKALAKELRIPILALSQLSRAVETRGGSKKPVLSDLRESGAIEQDADMVMFIYRPEYYKIDHDEMGPTQGMADIIIAKHRNGAVGDVRLRFISNFAKFTDAEYQETYFNENMTPNTSFSDADNVPKTMTFSSRMNDDFDGDENGVPF
jgi:replicative DNA helicase